MANEIRVRADAVAGALSAGLSTSDTSMSSGGLADLPAIGSTQHAAITLFQTDADGRVTKKEIVHVTAHTASATTATIVRAREGTTAETWSTGDKWVHGPLASDWPSPAHSYVGTTSIGGTWEALTNSKVLIKKVTLLQSGLLVSVSAHVRTTAANAVHNLAAAVFADNAGAPRELIGFSGQQLSDTLVLSHVSGSTGNGRWLHMPIGAYLTAADYWIAVAAMDAGSGEIAMVSTGGSDRDYTSGGIWFADAGFYTVNTTTKDYSIRASMLT